MILSDYKFEFQEKTTEFLEKLLDQLICLPSNTQLLDILPNINMRPELLLSISNFNKNINLKNIMCLNILLKQFNKTKENNLIKDDLLKKDECTKLWIESILIHLP